MAGAITIAGRAHSTIVICASRQTLLRCKARTMPKHMVANQKVQR